jgi:hypothetical protein
MNRKRRYSTASHARDFVVYIPQNINFHLLNPIIRSGASSGYISTVPRATLHDRNEKNKDSKQHFLFPNAFAMQNMCHVSLCFYPSVLSLDRELCVYPCARHKTVDHAPDTPRYLARLDYDLHPLHQRVDQHVNLLAASELICVQVQHLERDISSQTRDPVVGDVFDQPSQDGLQGHFVPVAEGSLEGTAVDEGGYQG